MAEAFANNFQPWHVVCVGFRWLGESPFTTSLQYVLQPGCRSSAHSGAALFVFTLSLQICLSLLISTEPTCSCSSLLLAMSPQLSKTGLDNEGQNHIHVLQHGPTQCPCGPQHSYFRVGSFSCSTYLQWFKGYVATPGVASSCTAARTCTRHQKCFRWAGEGCRWRKAW